MDVSSYPDGEGYIVEVKGPLTSDQHLGRLPAAVERVLEGKLPPLVKVKVTDVEMTDLDGVAALVRSHKITKEHGARFALIDGQPIRQRLEHTGLLRLLEEGTL